MPRGTFRTLSALSGHFRTGMRTRMMVIVLGIAFVSSVLAACGASAPAVKSTPTPIPTHVIAPAPSPTFTPTPKPSPTQQVPTQKPTPTHVPAPTPTPMPIQGAPAVLDLRPSSMSIVGHLDCQKNGAFVCFARVLSGPSNQSNLHWSAFTNVPGDIVFSPASGVLAPGQSVLVTITLPFTACTPGLFFFRGPVNTHTITWAC